MRPRLAYSLVLSILVALTCSAQVKPTQIDAIFSSLKSSDAPGAAVLVVHNGKPVFRQGYGVGDLRTHRPLDPKTDFRLASFTKQFTATCIMFYPLAARLQTEAEVQRDSQKPSPRARDNHRVSLPALDELDFPSSKRFWSPGFPNIATHDQMIQAARLFPFCPEPC